jgi:putative SOS response-associated peptidase YedK
MCSQFGNSVSYRQYVEAADQLGLPLLRPEPGAAPNLEPRDEIRPTNEAQVLRRFEHGLELATLRWGFAPPKPKAGPWINYRSDGRTFGRNRCLIPVSCFYEFTGKSYPKTRWAFTRTDEDWFCLAGMWRKPEGDWPESFTMLTCEPGPDMVPFHNRQPVVLARKDWARWLDPEAPYADLLQPPAEGTLAAVQRARRK